MSATRKALVVITWKNPAAPLERRVLLLKVTDARGGFWQPVTGKVEEGESFEAGGLREAEEETGFRFSGPLQYLGMEYSFQGRHGFATERAYLLTLREGASPPIPTLDPKEHVAFQWVAPAEALRLLKFPSNQQAVERATLGNPPVFLSRAGAFIQDGEEITHARTAELLHRSLVKEGEDFLVRMGNESLEVVLEDTPRFVELFDADAGEIRVKPGEREKLRPETLRIRADNSLVCTLANGWEALFLSPAYYALMKEVREESGKYVLHFLGRDHALSVPH